MEKNLEKAFEENSGLKKLVYEIDFFFYKNRSVFFHAHSCIRNNICFKVIFEPKSFLPLISILINMFR